MAIVRAVQRIGGFEVTAVTNGRFKENCYIIACPATRDCLIIDPGAEAVFIHEYLRTERLIPQRILLTHGHFDHIGAVAPLMTEYGIPCYVDEKEARLIRQAPTYAFRFDRGGEPVSAPRGLRYFEGELQWNECRIGVISIPGHTHGSVALAFDQTCVFTGDTLLFERVGPTTYPESEPKVIGDSISRLLRDLAAECVVFPGHGRPWSIAAAQSWWASLEGIPPALSIF